MTMDAEKRVRRRHPAGTNATGAWLAHVDSSFHTIGGGGIGNDNVNNLGNGMAANLGRQDLLPERLDSGENIFEAYEAEQKYKKYMEVSDYNLAYHNIWIVHRRRPDDFNTMLLLIECYIYLEKFYVAHNFFYRTLEPALVKKCRPGPGVIVMQARSCRDSGMYFRSLTLFWCAYSSFDRDRKYELSLNGIWKIMGMLKELFLEVFEKYGDSKDKYCQRFAEIYVRHLIQCQCLEKYSDCPGRLLDDVALYRAEGMASCYLLLEEFEKSLEYFDLYARLLKDADRDTDLRICLVGDFVARVALCYKAAKQQVDGVEGLIDESREEISKYEKTEDDGALKRDVFRFMDDYAADVKLIEDNAHGLLVQLFKLFFRR